MSLSSLDYSDIERSKSLKEALKDGLCTGYDHVTFYVGSVDAVSQYLIHAFGFEPYCSMTLETGSRDIYARVLRNNKVIFQIMGTVRPTGSSKNPLVEEIHHHLAEHGDSVKDVAFSTSNVQGMFDKAVKAGGKAIMKPTTYKDEFGELIVAKLGGIGDTVHTLVDRSHYKGFLQGPYQIDESSIQNDTSNKIDMVRIDHIVQNDGWNKMMEDCLYYRKVFGFHRFWSVDEKQIHTKYSALRSTVMTSRNGSILMPVNEPAKGLKTSQIEEFMEFNGAPGIQHIAIKVPDILNAVKIFRKRGVEFINVPETYYNNLENRLSTSKHPKIKESMDTIRKLGILVDFDEKGYLLQLFTRPIFDRPTFFFEIIQRHNHNGFGAGNFKGLFEVLEGDQARRGNLRDST